MLGSEVGGRAPLRAAAWHAVFSSEQESPASPLAPKPLQLLPNRRFCRRSPHPPSYMPLGSRPCQPPDASQRREAVSLG